MKKPFNNALFALLAIPLLLACTGNPASQNKEITLKDALKDKFLIGTALNASQITGRDTAGIRVVTENFNAIVAENCMKSEEVHPEENQYNFALADSFVNFGISHKLTVTGHTLIWHSQLPKWFCHTDQGELVSADVLKERMKNHIYTLVGRYKGKIRGWDVVNEAINDDGSWRNSPFYQILGEEFMYLAFQYAHEADPDAELYYNDYNEWHPGKRNAIVKMVNTMKERGLRIDAIGMQGHVGMDYPSLNEYQEAIDTYVAAGVKVMITEFEISALPSPRPNVGANISDIEAYNKEMNPYTNGLPTEVSQAWSNHMMDFFNLFLKNSDHILRVTLWGVADGDSWKNDFPMRGRTDYPLLFDRNHQAKPVVQSIIDAATHKDAL
ncbi:endo-1,4-beta-xylanase [Bacteroides sp. 519]|uniref:endo-1,4-beta-xylanase n=1 Tax=Bacteroides sp. 519 TaxID=2302937 RepID=UPI0013D13206|nr:endo-1,4-beta-xylanase [Bacteroides sp. 519]NDV60600.1 endo-1,4-beta-xylanase [Bacteroides sp. 519]